MWYSLLFEKKLSGERERETYEVKIIVPEGRIQKGEYLLATIKSGCCLFTLLAFSRGQQSMCDLFSSFIQTFSKKLSFASKRGTLA